MFDPKFLSELTNLFSKFEQKPNTTMFVMAYDHDEDSFTGTPVFGKMFSGEYDIREGM